MMSSLQADIVCMGHNLASRGLGWSHHRGGRILGVNDTGSHQDAGSWVEFRNIHGCGSNINFCRQRHC